MRIGRPTLLLAHAALLLALGSGCQALQPYRPVLVLARDAETRQPIAGASVRVSNPGARPSVGPDTSSGVTGADGVAHLRALPRDEAGLVVEAASEGYLYEAKTLTAEAMRSIPQGRPFGMVDQSPPAVVLEMYAEPRPTVELVVPAGYRGLVKAEVRVHEDAHAQDERSAARWWELADAKAHGPQRLFRYEVGPSGVVQATGPPLLLHDPDFRVRYADGTPATWQATDSPLGFWRLRSEGACQCLLVGTAGDYEALRHSGQAADRPSNDDEKDRRVRRGQQADGAPVEPVVDDIGR